MYLKKKIGYLIILAQFCLPIAPCYANPFRSIDEIDENITRLRKTYTSLPTSLNFKSQPGRTAAGTLLYALKNEKVYVLLGKRNDSANAWCNFGGGSEEAEDGEISLAQTAARETEEESRNLYSFHPELLRHQPYIDTHNGTLFYRMYWQKVPFIDPAVLRSKSGQTAVQQEFTDFQWVEAGTLLSAVRKQKPLLSGSESSSVQLYPELFSTLSTPAGRVFLQGLVDEGKISRFNRDVRPYINRLYWIREKSPSNDSNPMPSPKWPTVLVDAESEALGAEKLARVNHALSPLPICPPLREKDPEHDPKLSEHKKRLQKFYAAKDSFASAVFEPNKYQRVDLDQPADRSILARSVAAHVGMLIELKKKTEKLSSIASTEIDVESYSDLSLRIILGPDYKTKDDFPESANPQEDVDDHNIKVFLDRFYRDKDVHKVRGKVDILDSDLHFMKTVLQKSRRHGLRPTFYHATSESFYGLYIFFTHLRQFMMARPLNGLVGLRGIDTYFQDLGTMEDVIRKYGYSDYTRDHTRARVTGPNARQNIVLCANCTAFAGLSTTQTSSSSLEYVLKNHTVAPPDLGSTIQEALALSGFDAPTNSYFASLLSQFVSQNPDFANSVMLSLFMDPKLLDDYTYAARGGGAPYTQTIGAGEVKKEKDFTLSEIFDGIRREAERQLTAPESFEENKDEKCRLVSEARIFLHPKIMHGSDVYVDATPRFPMGKSQKSQFEHLTHLICMAMLGDWLTDSNQVLEGAFLNPPVARTLFHRIYYGLTGVPAEEKLSFEGFFHLVRHGLVEAVETYVETFPAILEEATRAKDRVLVAALKSDSPKMLKFVFNRLSLSLSDEDVTKLLRIAKDSHWLRSMNFLLNYLQSEEGGLSDRFIPVLYFLLQPEKGIFGINLEGSAEKSLQLMQLLSCVSSPDGWFKNKLCRQFLLEFSLEDCFVLCDQIFFPSELLQPEDFLQYIQNLFSTTSFGRFHDYGLGFQRAFLHFLKLQTASKEGFLDSQYLFGLSDWLNPLCKDLIDYVSAHRDGLTARNDGGLTLLGKAQMGYLSGRAIEVLPSIVTLYRQAGIDVSAAAYPPFLDLYGPDFNPEKRSRETLLGDPAKEFVFEENRQWVMALANATPNDYVRLLETCPDLRLFQTFQPKLEKLVLSSVMEQRRRHLGSEAWVNKVYISLKQMRQGPAAPSERDEPFGFLAGLPGDLFNEQMRAQMQMMQIASQQFSEFNGLSTLQEDENTEDLPTLFGDIPGSVESLDQFLETLETHELWPTGIVDYLKTLPEYKAVVVPAFEGREEKVAETKDAWITTAHRLVGEKKLGLLYDHVQSMPYLPYDEYKEISALIDPFSPQRSWKLYPWEAFSVKNSSKWLSGLDELLRDEKESARDQVHDFIERAPASALRRSMVLFLNKERAGYLPRLVERAYRSGYEFAEEHEFRMELQQSDTKLPETYHHPFPYILMSENPTELVRAFAPFLDGQHADKLLRGLDEDQFIRMIQRNKAGELKELIDIVPWVFQQDKFIQTSIRFLPKAALRQLVLKSSEKLKTSETDQRFLPYFVYLMMDGQNAGIIKEALHVDPTLLDIKSLDGMGMDDFLMWYASPSVAQVVRDIQKIKCL